MVGTQKKISPKLLAEAARQFGRQAGKARAEKLTPVQRTAIARKGGLARQAKTRSKEKP